MKLTNKKINKTSKTNLCLKCYRNIFLKNILILKLNYCELI
uniref:Uncharacterized protein n=1 Tax=Caloglossa beccarii TaxID=131038 RepID=A0A1Z1M949_9FLOR|nr:hypothetical protein [Caloglossa beccarii]ARW62264.1 hypothetical protein [Caloglossa beccarii]